VEPYKVEGLLANRDHLDLVGSADEAAVHVWLRDG
jgi:hypothetical protein